VRPHGSEVQGLVLQAHVSRFVDAAMVLATGMITVAAPPEQAATP
jgi:hypothetical protein